MCVLLLPQVSGLCPLWVVNCCLLSAALRRAASVSADWSFVSRFDPAVGCMEAVVAAVRPRCAQYRDWVVIGWHLSESHVDGAFHVRGHGHGHMLATVLGCCFGCVCNGGAAVWAGSDSTHHRPLDAFQLLAIQAMLCVCLCGERERVRVCFACCRDIQSCCCRWAAGHVPQLLWAELRKHFGVPSAHHKRLSLWW